MIYSIMHLLSPTRIDGIIDGRSTAFLIYSGQAGGARLVPAPGGTAGPAAAGGRGLRLGRGRVVAAILSEPGKQSPESLLVMVTPETRSEERGQVTWDTGDHTWEELLTQITSGLRWSRRRWGQ